MTVLVGFYRKSKPESTQNYQIYIIAVTTAELLTFALYSLSVQWCNDTIFSSWCPQSLPVLWYGYHVSFTLENSLTTTKLFLSISMAADRVLALARPVLYKTLRKVRHRRAALCICFFLGLSTSVFDGFRMQVIWNPTTFTYSGKVDKDFINSSLGIGLAWLRNTVRIVGLIILIILNVAVLRLYHRKMFEIFKASANDKLEMERRKDERALVAVTVTQSFCTAVDMTFHCIYYSVQYMAPFFAGCTGKLMTPIFEFTAQVTAAGQFFAVLRVSASMRSLADDSLRSLRNCIFCKAWRNRVDPARASRHIVQPERTSKATRM